MKMEMTKMKFASMGYMIGICLLLLLLWPIPQAAGAEKVLGVLWDFQHKDTYLLCLEGDNETGDHPWDAPHPGHNVHGNTYCYSAVTSMIANYFLALEHPGQGYKLSQDRISFTYGEHYGSIGYPPDFAFKHGGTSGHGIEWALDTTGTSNCNNASFSDLKNYIDNDRPMAVAWDGHYRVIDGYRDDTSGQFVHILDPWPITEPADNDKWKLYSTIPSNYFCVAAPASAPNVRWDEATIWMDSDGDGIYDFDETQRFSTDPSDPDTDGDGVPDKADMREYLFDASGVYGPPNFYQQMKADLESDYPAMVDTDSDGVDDAYAVTMHMNASHPIFPHVNFDVNTGDPISWTDNWPLIDKIKARADFDGDSLRKELDPDNDGDGIFDGEEDLNKDGIFQIDLDETSNFNPDTTPPATQMSVSGPTYTNGLGILCVQSSTRHTLSAEDSGPEDHKGIHATYYRYYPEAGTPVNFATYGGPFMLSGSDGNFTIEFFSKDLAGNRESDSQQTECLDNLPPDLYCPADLQIECTAASEPADTGSATALDACDTDPSLIYTDAVQTGSCPGTEVIERTWTSTDAFGHAASCTQTIEKVDTTAPVITINAPASISPPSAPITFTASATDNCGVAPTVEITSYDCYKLTKKGKRINKTESCMVTIWGNTITILESGGVETHITWHAMATDACGNTAEEDHEIVIANPND